MWNPYTSPEALRLIEIRKQWTDQSPNGLSALRDNLDMYEMECIKEFFTPAKVGNDNLMSVPYQIKHRILCRTDEELMSTYGVY